MRFMINIFVTYRCNMHCPYCFASHLKAVQKKDMTLGDFQRLLAWMRGAGVVMAGFIGGEPTLHPNLKEMMKMTRDAGISVTLFTNATFDPRLVSEVASHVDNFVVNYNDPEIYPSRTLQDRLHENLTRLSQKGARMTFSKNFSPSYSGYAYLLEGARHYGVRAIRYDISRPASLRENEYFTGDETREVTGKIVSFVQACEAEGIKTGLDCCMKFCDLSHSDRTFLERVSMKFTGICHPSIDIHPDLSASYCLPMSHVQVPDVTAFPSQEAVRHHFAAAVRPLRYEISLAACSSCNFFKRRCQGGCLATKQHEALVPNGPKTSMEETVR
ncbi:radical SAM domain protein [delta proteobacterium NaphS2]|nr:radical SAM domain protein [delta proteobacterium NaphS2]